jgi:hypothetical protein
MAPGGRCLLIQKAVASGGLIWYFLSAEQKKRFFSKGNTDQGKRGIMSSNSQETVDKYEEIDKRAQERLKAGRDPGVTRWQAALEAMLVAVEPYLIAGEVVTTESLSPEEIELFQKIQLVIDLAPFSFAIFLPPVLANTLNPSGLAKTLDRAPEVSNKILVSRVNDYRRILTAELSPAKPGIDIYENGALLGSYNYNTPEECLGDLSKIIWIHLKHQGSWTKEDYIKYTEGWFYRSASNKILDLPINQNHSYIHHPVLLNIKTVEAIFRLIKSTLLNLCDTVDYTIAMANANNLYNSGAVKITRSGLANSVEAEENFLRTYIEEKMLALLKLLRGYEIINFRSFSQNEQNEFKKRFNQTVEEVFQEIIKKI